jgi:polar amino acid transport system substrate-binding protein/glutamate/aspartate transport system substrate-binding protein
MVDLCRAVADGLAKQIGMADLKVTYVPVTSTDRFDAITGGKADLLCEATTVTLRRRESLGFSLPLSSMGRASSSVRPARRTLPQWAARRSRFSPALPPNRI